eukprot:g2716.t1
MRARKRHALAITTPDGAEVDLSAQKAKAAAEKKAKEDANALADSELNRNKETKSTKKIAAAAPAFAPTMPNFSFRPGGGSQMRASMAERARSNSQAKRERQVDKTRYSTAQLMTFKKLKELQILPEVLAKDGKFITDIMPPPPVDNSGRGSTSRGGKHNGWSRGKTPKSHHRGGRNKGNYYSDPDVSGYVLKSTENPWTREKAANDGVAACQKLMVSLLNKLTREKFDKITSQIVAIEFNTRPLLKRMIYCIFDKALGEPHFSELYADVCLTLSRVSEEKAERMVHVEQNSEDGKFYFDVGDTEDQVSSTPYDTKEAARAAGLKASSFKRILLTKCQEEFEKKVDWDSFKNDVDWESLKDDPVATRRAKEEAEYRQMLAKKRMLGNITFIGCLFKESLISEVVLHHCLNLLLKEISNPGEDDVECVCKLLTNVGKFLKSKPHIDSYFDRLEILARHKKMSSRTRFMVQDVIALRKNKWIPRRKVEKVQTKAEVRQQAAAEEIAKSREANRNRNDYRSNGRRRDYRRQTGNNNRSGGGPVMPKVHLSKQNRNKKNDATQKTKGNHAGKKGKQQSVPEVVELTVEEYKKKCLATLKEYVHLNDMSEAKTCMGELHFSDTSAFVNVTLDFALNSSPKENEHRIRSVELVSALTSSGYVTKEKLKEGILQVLQELDDLSIDVPKAPQYFSEFLANLITKKQVELASILNNVDPSFVEFGGAAKMLLYLLRSLVTLQGIEKTKLLLNDSKFDCQKLMRKNGKPIMTDLKLWAVDNEIEAVFSG